MTRIAAPDYIGKHSLAGCPPGHRFSLYFPLWNGDWGIDRKEGAKSEALKTALNLGDGSELLAALRQRQLALAQALPESRRLIIDVTSTAPFTTGLGNEHPVENGFAFLTPYGLPYLAASGFKGVLRCAAQQLRDDAVDLFTDPLIDALFGPEDRGADDSGPKVADGDRRRGALTFWDVFPEPADGNLAIEIMTPHHGDYYAGDDSPHDAGQPKPIPFLALPAGSKLRFVLVLEPVLWPPSMTGADWKPLAEVALRHAFDWLGFGAKTALGYGAMEEDADARKQRTLEEDAAREARLAAERELRHATLGPEQIEAEEAIERLAKFNGLLAAERSKGTYKKGGAFDQQRAEFLKRSIALQYAPGQVAAAKALRESYKFTGWPANADSKRQVKQSLTNLDGQP